MAKSILEQLFPIKKDNDSEVSRLKNIIRNNPITKHHQLINVAKQRRYTLEEILRVMKLRKFVDDSMTEKQLKSFIQQLKISQTKLKKLKGD